MKGGGMRGIDGAAFPATNDSLSVRRGPKIISDGFRQLDPHLESKIAGVPSAMESGGFFTSAREVGWDWRLAGNKLAIKGLMLQLRLHVKRCMDGAMYVNFLLYAIILALST